MEFPRDLLVDDISTIEESLKDAQAFHKLGYNKKERAVVKKNDHDYSEDYHVCLKLAMRCIDGYEGEPTHYFDECYLPSTDNCVSAYLRLLDDENIKRSLMLAAENEVAEMKHKLKDLGKPLISYLESEKIALIKSREYFQESIKVRERTIKTFKNSEKELPRSFLSKKKIPVSQFDLWNKCLVNELERSHINRDIYDSYWIYPKGYQYPEWRNHGYYGEFYKMYLRDYNSSYCSIDVGLKRNEDNIITVVNLIKEFGG